jgi:hypothetical protein
MELMPEEITAAGGDEQSTPPLPLGRIFTEKS